MAVTPKIRRSYKGAPVSAVLDSSGVSSATQTAITLTTSPSTWPTGKFFVVVAPGTAQEEKMCVTVSGSTMTVVDPSVTSNSASANGRGVDDTTARSTIAGGATVYPVATARDFDEANQLTATYANQGGIVYLGDPSFTQLAIGTAGQVLKVNSGATAPEWGQVAAAGIASDAVTTAKILDANVTTAKIADASVTADKIASAVAGAGLAGGAGTALSVNVDSSTIEIDSDSLRVKDAGIVAAKLASNSVETAKIADAAVTNAKLAGATGTWTPTRSSGTFSYAEGSYYMVGQIMYFYLFGDLSSNITTTLNILLPSGTYDSGKFGITGHYNYGSVYLYVIGTCGSSGAIGVNLLDGTSGMLTDIYNHPINSPQRGNGDQIILRGWVRKTA